MSLSTACRRRLSRPFRLAAAVAVAVLSAGAWVPAAAARAAEWKPLAIVTCDSYADLKKQLGWLGGQVGQPGLAGMLESVLLMATQGRGLGGLDVKRPLGVIATTDGQEIAVHGYVPVKSLDKLLESLQGVTGPVERAGESRNIVLPSGLALSIAEKDGWAIIAPQGSRPAAADPAVLLAPLADNYSLAVEGFPSLMPEWLRQQLRFMLEQQAAAAGPEGQTFDPRAIAAAVDGLADTESLSLGLTIDPDKNRVFLENRTVGVAGSATARAMQGSDAGRLTVPLPRAADGGRPAVTGHLLQAVPEAARREVLAGLEAALPQGSDDPLTRTIATVVRELLASVLGTGGIDAALAVDPPAGGGDGPKVPHISLGVRVQDGKALEAQVKQALGPAGESGKRLPPGVKVAFDTGKVAGATLHTITVDLSDTDAAETLGRSVAITLAIAPEHAFVLVGGDPAARLAGLLGPEAQTDPQARPIAGLDIALGRVLAFAGAAQQEADADGGDGKVQLLVRPLERGLATRLIVDGQALKTAAAAGAANAEAPGGQPLPPGLPLPGGFPIPVPAQ
jgi:hypothetical protein